MRGSNNFIDNIDWWYWDNAKYPCLINRDQFRSIRSKLLSSEDHSLLNTSLMLDTLVSFDGTKAPPNDHNRLMKKLAILLEQELSKHPESYSGLTEYEFNENPQTALKAHINILEYWGLGYTWEDALNHRGLPQLILKNKNKRQLVLPIDQMMFLQGRPYWFSLSLKGGSLMFDETKKQFVLTWRERGPDDQEAINQSFF
jgi:hypothetical protein